MRTLSSWFVAVLLLGISPVNAVALLTFGEGRPLNSNAATDVGPPPAGADTSPSIATDGSGTWVTVWASYDPGIGAQPTDPDIAVSRSTDAGQTWSDATLIYNDPSARYSLQATLAVSPSGTWIAAWAGGPSVARSVDGGQTWSAPIDFTGGGSGAAWLSAAGDSSGNWVLVWSADVSADQTQETLYSRSTDDGLTWTMPLPLPDAITAAAGGSTGPKLARGPNGTWICVWNDNVAGVSASRSTNAGATWSPRVLIDFSNFGAISEASVASDGSGNWIAAWNNATLGVVLTSVSTDDGQSWGIPAVVAGDLSDPYEAGRTGPTVTFSDNTWDVMWTQSYGSLGGSIGQEGDGVGTRSFDGGTTWTDAAAVNVNAGSDNVPSGSDLNFEGRPAIAIAPDGTAVAAYGSTNSFYGTVGTDGDIFFSRSEDNCPPTPNPACISATRPQASSLSYKNPTGGRDKLTWKWRSGGATLPSDFGDPTTTADYVFCLYDKAGGSLRDVLEADALAGGDCKSGPCWTVAGEGFRYRDADGRHGPIRSIRLVPGVDGAASIDLKAAGPALAPPPMPLAIDPNVRLQLVNVENGNCWEAAFSTEQTNTATDFRGKAD